MKRTGGQRPNSALRQTDEHRAGLTGRLGLHCRPIRSCSCWLGGPSGPHHSAPARRAKTEQSDRLLKRMTWSLLSFVADLEADGRLEPRRSPVRLRAPRRRRPPMGAPQGRERLDRPAREGALRVLRASRDAGVKRVVLTSSFAAVGYGHPPMRRPSTKSTGRTLTLTMCRAYVKSKTLAERAAWISSRPMALLHSRSSIRCLCSGPALSALIYSTSFVRHPAHARWRPCPGVRSSTSASSMCAMWPTSTSAAWPIRPPMASGSWRPRGISWPWSTWRRF